MAKSKSQARSQQRNPLKVLSDAIAKRLDADVLFYNAPIERHLDQRVIELCTHRRRRDNVALFLITSGGDADAAYRIATCLQTKFKRFILFVPGFCKSAGTLVALGAHEVVISDQGENGPLDVQMRRKDELIDSESGLTSMTALRTLNEQAYNAFEHFLLKITQGAQNSISTRTVTDIAVRMATGLFSHIYQQIDPMHVAEAARELEVAEAYGRRLASRSQNLVGNPDDVLMHLVSNYPSHGFIIDREEAKKIFKRVRDFTPEETALTNSLGSLGRWPVPRSREDDYILTFISSETPAQAARPAKKLPARRKANAKRKEPRPEAATRAGAGDAGTATGARPAVVAQIPTIPGIAKRHA